MSKMGEMIMDSSKKSKDRWRRSIEANGITKEISVKEADNDGYIINLTVYGDFKKENGEIEYKHNEKEFISKVNPLASEDDEFKKSMDSLESALGDTVQFEDI